MQKITTASSIGGNAESWSELSGSEFYGYAYPLSAQERLSGNRRQYDATHRLVTYDFSIALSQSDRIKRIEDSKVFKLEDIQPINGHHIEADLEEVTN